MTAVIETRMDYHLYGPVLSFHVLGNPIGQGRVSFPGAVAAVAGGVP